MPLSGRERTVVRVLALICVLCLGYLVIGLANLRPPAPAPRPSRLPRIISLSPAVSVILTDLGHADLIVGRDKSDMALDPLIPVCGDFPNLDYEAILSAAPTHIILQGEEPPPRLAELADGHGWAVRSMPLLSLDDIRRGTASLHQMVEGRPGRPVSPHPILTRMDAAWSPREGDLSAAGRVLLLEAIDPPAALGPGSFHHQVLERIGGRPAITDGKPYITLDLEDIRRLAPDGIILFRPRARDRAATGSEATMPATVDQVRALLGRIGTLEIPAHARGHLALIDDPLCLTPSTAMIGVADRMAEILAGWRAGP